MHSHIQILALSLSRTGQRHGHICTDPRCIKQKKRPAKDAAPAANKYNLHSTEKGIKRLGRERRLEREGERAREKKGGKVRREERAGLLGKGRSQLEKQKEGRGTERDEVRHDQPRLERRREKDEKSRRQKENEQIIELECIMEESLETRRRETKLKMTEGKTNKAKKGIPGH